jgi:hypothetical protein
MRSAPPLPMLCLTALLSVSRFGAAQTTNTAAIKPVQFVHITPQYSNAVLKALLPHFTDFARRMRLDVPLPLAGRQLRKFQVDPTAKRCQSMIM